MTHYVIVRRDLPYGLTLAMVGHAAGESFYAIQWARSVDAPFQRVDAIGAMVIPRCTIVVLGARNESRLEWLRKRLAAAGVPHVPFYESDPPYEGQLMSIGLVPGSKEDLAKHVSDFALWPYHGPDELTGDSSVD